MEHIIAEVINIKTRPQRPLNQRQEKGLKDYKDKSKFQEHHILENKGKPKVILYNPRNKNVKTVEVDNSGRVKDLR